MLQLLVVIKVGNRISWFVENMSATCLLQVSQLLLLQRTRPYTIDIFGKDGSLTFKDRLPWLSIHSCRRRFLRVSIRYVNYAICRSKLRH